MTFLLPVAADGESRCSYLLVDQQNAIDIQFQIEKVQSELHVVLGIKISRQKLISSLYCHMPRLSIVPLSALAAYIFFSSSRCFPTYSIDNVTVFCSAFPLSSCLEKFVISLRFFNGFIFIIISPGTHFFCSIHVHFFFCVVEYVCVRV